jgi:hypothetical protein
MWRIYQLRDGTNLESEKFQGIGETRERLVTGTGLGHQSKSSSDTSRFSVGNLYTTSLRDVVLEARSSGRGHAPTAGSVLERTGRISTDGRPRQHHRMCERTIGGERSVEAGEGSQQLRRWWWWKRKGCE